MKAILRLVLVGLTIGAAVVGSFWAGRTSGLKEQQVSRERTIDLALVSGKAEITSRVFEGDKRRIVTTFRGDKRIMAEVFEPDAEGHFVRRSRVYLDERMLRRNVNLPGLAVVLTVIGLGVWFIVKRWPIALVVLYCAVEVFLMAWRRGMILMD